MINNLAIDESFPNCDDIDLYLKITNYNKKKSLGINNIRNSIKNKYW